MNANVRMQDTILVNLNQGRVFGNGVNFNKKKCNKWDLEFSEIHILIHFKIFRDIFSD